MAYEAVPHEFQATTTPDVTLATSRALITLRELFGMSEDDKVFIKMFSSSLRGQTHRRGTRQKIPRHHFLTLLRELSACLTSRDCPHFEDASY